MTGDGVMKKNLSTLRLDFLKENFEYQTFFERAVECDPFPLDELCQTFTLNPRFFEKAEKENISFDEVKTFLNPRLKSDSDFLIHYISLLFFFPAVQYRIPKTLMPWERIVVVDLRHKKKQILKGVEILIDGELSEQNDVQRLGLTRYAEYAEYDLWAPDNSRQRQEAAEHLKVWRLRAERLPFADIAKNFNVSESTAKMRFYRAYELTQHEKYDVRRFCREALPATVCEDCRDRNSCTELCPPMIRYLKGLEQARRETRLSDLRQTQTDEGNFQDPLDRWLIEEDEPGF
jgi:hypothetical protein